MDYETLYKELIEKIKSEHEKADGITKESFERILPELRESEDERMRKIVWDILLVDSDEIREILDANNVLIQDVYAWLEKQCEKESVTCHICGWEIEKQGEQKSLKDRVQPQPKQEWSVDDERTYRSVLYGFEHNFPLNCVQQEFVKSHIQPQKQWKPNKEQIDALRKAVTDGIILNSKEGHTLRNLLLQLTKLNNNETMYNTNN